MLKAPMAIEDFQTILDSIKAFIISRNFQVSTEN